MKLIANIIVNSLAFYLLDYLVPGVTVEGYKALLITAIVWGIVITFIRPIIKLLTFPISLVTLGLFSFIINAGLLLLTSNLVLGFSVDTFATALISAILLTIINSFLNLMVKD